MNVPLLVLSNFKRHKLRTLLTILSIAVAFILFTYLATIRKSFEMGIGSAGKDRLFVRHKISLIRPLPESHEEEIERIDGIVDATPATWFGGVYREPKNMFPQMPVKPDEFMEMYPEYLLDDSEVAAWRATRTGAIAGATTAKRFGWKIGDKIPIRATIWHPKQGDTWTFDLVGIYEGKGKDTDTSAFYFRQDYFDENRSVGDGLIGWYNIRVADPDRSAQIAQQVDDHFANSEYETKTEPEAAVMRGFAEQAGNIGAIIQAILTAVFFIILIVAGNTMAQAIRERTSELGTLKAIGFSDLKIVAFVLFESILIAAIGGAIGLLIGWRLVATGDPTGGALPIFYLPPSAVALGALLVLLLGIATGALPAIQAMRLNAVEALRRE